MLRSASSLAILLVTACATPSATTGGGAVVVGPKQEVVPGAEGGAQGGAPATDFTLRDVDGQTVRLSDYKGQVVLIDFWATWCQPCEAEIPHLAALYEANKARGFVVLGISMDGPETVASVAPFVRRYNLAFPVLLDEETRVVGIYNPKRTAPLSVLIDRGGRIARVRAGYSPGDETLIAEDVKKLL